MKKRVVYFKYNETWGAFGSKEHFFHFFWGYLLPTISSLIQQEEKNTKISRIFCEDCGPNMNKVTLDMLDLLGYCAEIKNNPEPVDEIILVDRWDMLINFESIMYDDEYSQKGSISEWRTNPNILNIVKHKEFAKNFQSEILKVRRVVLAKASEDNQYIENQDRSNEARIETVEKEKTVNARFLLKRFIKACLTIFGPKLRDKIIRKIRNLIERNVSKIEKRRRRKKANVYLLERQDEPEYYSEKGSATAKTYGASRRTFVNTQEGLNILRKTWKVKVYNSGESSISDQINQYNKMDVAIGVKGAEFSNVIWMKPGAKIIQIIPRKMKTPPVYERIAKLIQVESVSVRSHEKQNPDLGKMASLIEYLIH